MAFSGSYSTADQSRLDLNQAGKISGINLAGQARTMPEFITQSINANSVTETGLGNSKTLVMLGVAGALLLLLIWSRKHVK